LQEKLQSDKEQLLRENKSLKSQLDLAQDLVVQHTSQLNRLQAETVRLREETAVLSNNLEVSRRDLAETREKKRDLEQELIATQERA
jgi:hypothetical protein